jgi:hypothetical protein
MPGNADAAESGWLRAVAVGLVVFQVVSHASAAYAGQSQSQIPVSAFVLVSGTVAASLSASIMPSTPRAAPALAASGNQSGAETPAIPAPPKQVCTSIAMSCSGRSSMRVSVDNASDGSSGAVHECSAQTQSSLSLCAAGANGPAGSLGLNIEY